MDNPFESLLNNQKEETFQNTLSFDQPFNISAAESLFHDSEFHKSGSISGYDLPSSVITNYRGFTNTDKNYKVDIIGAYLKADENETVISSDLSNFSITRLS